MQPLMSRGTVSYRTKAMADEKRAKAFAACLAKNSRFTGVAVVRSERTKAPAWYVTFAPVNPARQAAIVAGEQGKRQAKAAEEGAAYIFVLDEDGARPFLHCFNPKSGETYTLGTDGRGCDCPDSTYHLQGTGLKCKHGCAVAAAKADGRIYNW